MPSRTGHRLALIIPQAAYFTRGSGHNEKAQYSERGDDYQNNMERLNRKFETARTQFQAGDGGEWHVEGRPDRIWHRLRPA